MLKISEKGPFGACELGKDAPSERKQLSGACLLYTLLLGEKRYPLLLGDSGVHDSAPGTGDISPPDRPLCAGKMAHTSCGPT